MAGAQAKVDFTAERGQSHLVKIGSYGGDIDEEFDDPTLVVSIDRGRVKTREVNPNRPERFSFQGLEASAYDWWESEDEDGYSYGFEGVSIVQGRAGSDGLGRLLAEHEWRNNRPHGLTGQRCRTTS